MDFLRSHTLLRYGFMAGLIAAGAFIAPSIWEIDRTAASFGVFEHVPFVLSLVLAYAALRVGDAALRAKMAIGVIATFALAAAVMLSFSVPSLAFVALALAVGYLEWPVEASKARAY
jgi:hypothetical protein